VTDKRLLGWLRREARKGLMVGGLCTAAYCLAKAGLLDGKKATIHWENQDSFIEEFEEVDLTKSVFVVDGKRMSTAGGTSSIDLMLKLIADDIGEDLANAVADQLIYSAIRTDQRLSKARNLLMQTDMSVINVALACGFASPSHFSKCYRAHYETTPYRERGSHAARLSI
jgi:transcriptional regulator GlxA family with amidase domain